MRGGIILFATTVRNTNYIAQVKLKPFFDFTLSSSRELNLFRPQPYSVASMHYLLKAMTRSKILSSPI